MRWLWFVALAACGDNVVDEPAGSRSGERLELYWYEVDGGRVEASRIGGASDVFTEDVRTRMFDVVFDQECQLLTFGDGVTRCAPGIRRPESDGVTSFVVYTDAACTDARGRGSIEHDVFLAGEWVGERFAISQVVRGGLLSHDQPNDFFEKRDGACVAATNPGDGVLYDLDEVLDTDLLTAFSLVTLDSTSRVGSQALVGDDGTQVFTTFYDTALAAACTPYRDRDGVRCVPDDSRSVEGWFADAGCTQPAVPISETPTRFAADTDADDCITSFELAAPRLIPVFHRDGEACVPDGMGMYQVGTKLESPIVDYTYSDEPERIIQWSAAGVPRGLYDTEQQAACNPRFELVTTDPRCIPSSNGFTTTKFFADPSCTQPTEVVERRATQCSRQGRFATRGRDSFAVIGDEVEVFTRIDDHCIPYVPHDAEAIHAIDDIVPRDAFLPATLVHAR